ncbi:hypothetical protein [Traorella massiliensis]|uniref:hypothetical protein n=1 Tax=Traorella massiliensis TaxID=1903263 RepID=UPI0023573282|nr:hypothetical protein [Traorella massiliensis]
MPIVNNGLYIETEDKPYEAESAYYIDFQITSALYSLEKIFSNSEINHPLFKNKYQYYHYYCDHLIFSLGQISSRFYVTDKEKKNDSIRKRKEANIRNFSFSEDKYPMLSKRIVRNTIEHIDEHNQRVITKYRGVGGFNVIDNEIDEKVRQALINKRHLHPYTLNLISNELWIMRNEEEYELDLIALKNELLMLQNDVRYLLSLASDMFTKGE